MSNKKRQFEPFDDDDTQNDSVKASEVEYKYPADDITYPDLNSVDSKTPQWSDANIKLVNLDAVNGRVIAYLVDSPTEFYWVPVDRVHLVSHEQVVSSEILANAERPYNWDIELDAIAVDVNELRLGLYYLGYHSQQEINVKEVLRKLLSRGFLPIKKG